jgi:hypothetical protein
MTDLNNLNKYDWLRLVLRVPFTPENRDQNASADPDLPEERRWKGQCLEYSYSSVSILNPQDRSVFNPSAEITFEGQITRSSETNWEDYSDDLEWRSHLKKEPLGMGRCIKTSLEDGTHVITAYWPAKNRKDSIVIYVRTEIIL